MEHFYREVQILRTELLTTTWFIAIVDIVRHNLVMDLSFIHLCHASWFLVTRGYPLKLLSNELNRLLHEHFDYHERKIITIYKYAIPVDFSSREQCTLVLLDS